MRKTAYQLAKERRQARNAIEREKDTIYYLDFIPKDRQATLDDTWSVRLPRGRQNDPKAIDDAIRTFEQDHKVSSWQDIASGYVTRDFHYP